MYLKAIIECQEQDRKKKVFFFYELYIFRMWYQNYFPAEE